LPGPGSVADPMSLCVLPSKPGDPCQIDSDCREAPTAIDENGTTIVDYLACDVAAGTCVAEAPPVIADYLDTCGLLPNDDPYKGFAWNAPLCESDRCVRIPDPERGCLLQGCTTSCSVDQECPQGSRCTDINEIAGEGEVFGDTRLPAGRPEHAS